MNRQQRRKQERVKETLLRKGEAFRKTSPMAEEVYHQGYEVGWKAACDFCMRVCYAASTLALHDLEGYSTTRNTRFLRLMDRYVTDTLTSEDIIEEAFAKGGVAINFKEVFEEDRVQEARK
jgi:hypothetical protein